jgi:FkbM family methyltransferase
MDQHLISAPHAVNGTILHLGAGECRELASYLETSAEQIVLVEPDPELALALRKRTAAEPRVKVIEAAVANQAGEAKLHRYNVTGQATLHPLKALPIQWPGLRDVAQLQVRAMDVAELLKQAALAEGKQHWLVIEAPGEEHQVLRAIGKPGASQRFAYLSLTIGGLTPQVEQTRPLLLQTLEVGGYRLEHVSTQAGQLVYHAKADSQWEVLRELQGELKKAEEANQQLKKQQQGLEKLQASNGSLRQENRQLKVENEEIQQRQALLEEELRKAEVQIELIKELFLSKEEAEQLESKERDA